MIIGPNATFVIEPIRSSFLDHVYDFYKPDPRKSSISNPTKEKFFHFFLWAELEVGESNAVEIVNLSPRGFESGVSLLIERSKPNN